MRVSKLIIATAMVFMAQPVETWAVNTNGFSMNRGWPDIGRGLSSSLGAGRLNPASLSQSNRYMGGIASNWNVPTGDWALHAAVQDSQSTSLAAEFMYDYIHHGTNDPGIYTGATTDPRPHTHRMHLAVSEFYGEVIHVGLRAGADIAKGPAGRKPTGWDYGLGIMVPFGDHFQIGVESGNWFKNYKSPFQSGNVGGGFGILFEKFAVAGDVNYRWFVPSLGQLLSAGGGISVRPIEMLEFRSGYRWNPGEDENTVAGAAQVIVFPWVFSVDGGYTMYTKRSGAVEVGLTISRAFFVSEDE